MPHVLFAFCHTFEIPLRFLEQHTLCFSAFVDDISSPSRPMCTQRKTSLVQEALSLIGCQTNVIKSEVLPIVSPPPPVPTLPKYLHPVLAVPASNSIWSTDEADAPHWADASEQPFRGVSYLMHLGHPPSASLCLSLAVRIVAEDLKAKLSELHTSDIEAVPRTRGPWLGGPAAHGLEARKPSHRPSAEDPFSLIRRIRNPSPNH